jgi:hypothetical protein
MNRPWIVPAVIAVLVLLIICCICLVLAFGAGAWLFLPVRSSSSPEALQPTPEIVYVTATPPEEASPTPRPTRTPTSTREAGQPTLEVEPTPSQMAVAASDPQGTLKTLNDTLVPINDPADLAKRLEGKGDIPPTLPAPATPPKVGDEQSFWALNTDTNENFQVQATLRYITNHAYFWIENGVDYNARDLRLLGDTFEKKIYPTDREFFGSEWSPGVDGDVHLYVLYASGLGSHIAGYFSSIDSYPPQIHEFSNGHEMFDINADGPGLDDEYTAGVLAHEFQHMIHWYRDRNEETWMNEGFSDLAMFLNGYAIGGHDFIYAENPDIQLNYWPAEPEDPVPHYGAAFLFMNYFLDRFGEQATKALVADPENGLTSIDKTLSELGITDPLTRQTVGADDVFMDWELTSYLQDKRVGDGRFVYRDYPDAPQPTETERVRNCGTSPQERQVHQYGVDYILFQCRGDYTLHFEGAPMVGVIPQSPHSGAYAFWSNLGDESDMTLTQQFDFTSNTGPLTLGYWTWYDIEKDFDYLYVEASLDGENWTILTTPSGTDTDPTGANYGWGYTGTSGDGPTWIFENLDLSQYAGKKVQLRFEYITDGAVYGDGFLLDDVSIPEIGYSTDFESDDGGWTAEGFVRIQNSLPQTFRLALIKQRLGSTVEYIPLSADNKADIPLQFGDGFDTAVLVVVGTARYTRQLADYQFYFGP